MLQLTELGSNNPFWFQTHKYWQRCCRAHCCRQMWNKTNFVSLILSVLQMLVFTTFDFHFNKKLSRCCYCCSSHIFSATVFNGIKLILSLLLKERIEKGLCSFPSHSPFQFLPHFPTRLPQWHGSVASVISRLRGAKKSPTDCFFSFLLLLHRSSTRLFYWAAVSETTRALMFVVLWLLFPAKDETHQAVRCRLEAAPRMMSLLVLGTLEEWMKALVEEIFLP